MDETTAVPDAGIRHSQASHKLRSADADLPEGSMHSVLHKAIDADNKEEKSQSEMSTKLPQ